jgi:hypothetical protein
MAEVHFFGQILGGSGFENKGLLCKVCMLFENTYMHRCMLLKTPYMLSMMHKLALYVLSVGN